MFIMRAALLAAISLGLASSAMAAESQASSMAGGMSDSGATVHSSSMAVENGQNQASGQSTSSSATQRSSQSHNYDSAMNAGGQSQVVKNAGAGTGNTSNTSNSLIQNNVRQDSVTLKTGSSSSTAAMRSTPHTKVQYWNQRSKMRTRTHR
ncbi:MAG: hypothetical protein JSS86_04490 [Cyanobacteria bacterium SZAS LIN-2]|nr:hypothetical protein [Cyanobacteria bacterium SZAS LIN-2]